MKKRLITSSIILALLLANASWWGYLDRPHEVKPASERLDCVSYNPYRNEYSMNARKKDVSRATLETDLAIIAKRFRCVRVYTTLHGMDMVPEVAAKYGLNVITGVWISGDLLENLTDLELALAVTNKYANVTHLIIGNEALFFDDITPKYLYLYLSYANEHTKKPISTGEIVSTWDEYKMLVDYVDFIAIHVFPYWNSIAIDKSIDYLEGEYNLMHDQFPDKEVMVAETGWPSMGVDRGDSRADLLAQATYIRTASKFLEEHKIRYNIIEAFDQPWKIFGTEKQSGGSFGVFDDRGREKFSLAGPLSLYGSSFMVRGMANALNAVIAKLPTQTQEQITPYISGQTVYTVTKKLHIDSDIGLATCLIFFCIGLLLIIWGSHLRIQAFIWGSLTLLGLTNILVMIAYKAWIGHYLMLTQFWINVPLMMLPIMGILYQLRDYLKIIGRGNIRNHLTYKELVLFNEKRTLPSAGQETKNEKLAPFVSLHIPSYNEEPEMLINTINHVAKLEYQNFELIILENNTRNPAIWEPVEAHVKAMNDPRIRFYHFDHIAGFKSGALNKALELTDPRATIIGLLDADYCVDPQWLSLVLPLFDNSEVAAVQCPQANRIEHATFFQKIMSYELDLFYKQGMIIRNQNNAVVMNGTMCLIRKEIFDIEAWDNGFICEDAEFGIRVLGHGKKILYIDHTFGTGLPPRNFAEYTKQRFRWAYGAMMILKKHWRMIFLPYYHQTSPQGKKESYRISLTLMQRFEYMFGWIGWGQMILYPFYLLILLFGSYFIYESYSFEAPYDFALLTLYYVFFLMISTAAIYRDRMQITLHEAWLAILASASLTVTIFRAVFLALFWEHMAFKKTNKGGVHKKKGRLSWVRSNPGFLLLFLINITMIILAASTLFRYGVNKDTFVWFLLIVTITLPTMGAFIFQLVYE